MCEIAILNGARSDMFIFMSGSAKLFQHAIGNRMMEMVRNTFVEHTNRMAILKMGLTRGRMMIGLHNQTWHCVFCFSGRKLYVQFETHMENYTKCRYQQTANQSPKAFSSNENQK